MKPGWDAKGRGLLSQDQDLIQIAWACAKLGVHVAWVRLPGVPNTLHELIRSSRIVDFVNFPCDRWLLV